MDKIKKIFFEQDLTWKKIIVLSIICGVITGIIPLIPILDGTSIQNITEHYEIWVFLAMFIIMNSKKPFEAGSKTFMFFLISQPLFYLVQVPFVQEGFRIFRYYVFWGYLTILTFPGAILAWHTKKGNWFSVLILSVALLLLNYELFIYFSKLLKSFPYQLLAVLFVLFEDVLFINLLFNEKKKKTVLCIICVIAVIYAFINTTIANRAQNSAHAGACFLGNDRYTLVEKGEDAETEHYCCAVHSCCV